MFFRSRSVRAALSALVCAALLPAAVPVGAGGVTAESTSPIKIACIGDSVTWGVGGTSYPTQLQQMLGNGYEVKNFGISGACARDDGYDNANNKNDGKRFGYRTSNPATGDWNYNDVYQKIYDIGEGKSKYEQSLAYQADIYIIALGGNDSKDCNWSRQGAKRFKDDLRSIVEEYAALPHHPLVIVGTSPGAVKATYGLTPSALKKFIVPDQRALAEEMGLPLVETYNYTLEENLFSDDGVHLNTAGYKIVATQYYNAITTLVADPTPSAVTANGEAGEIDEKTASVYVTLPADADLAAVTLTATVAGRPVTVESADLTGPYDLLLTSMDGAASKVYTVYATTQRKIKVACTGDSITAGGFPADLQTLMGAAYDVKNFGVNSTTAQESGQKETDDRRGAYIYHGAYAQSLDYKPDVVFILLGANDTKQGAGQQKDGYDLVTNWNDETSPAAFQAGITGMVEAYRALQPAPTVVLVTSPKAYSTDWAVNPTVLQEQVVPMQRELAQTLSCPLVDLNDVITRDMIGGDGLHPNADGNRKIAEEYAAALQELYKDGVPFDAPRAVSIAVQSLPEKIGYALGEELSVAGGEVLVKFDDGSERIFPMRTAMTGNFDPALADVQDVTVSLYGQETFFTVVVEGAGVLGDVNGDDVSDTTDARLVLQKAAGKLTDDYIAENGLSFAVETADVSGDGNVDTTDARLILQKAAGKIDVFPAESLDGKLLPPHFFEVV